MKRFHLCSSLLILALTGPAIADEALKHADNPCRDLADDCQLSPCPCRAGETPLKVIPDPSSGHTLCACSRQGDDRLVQRRKAADSCHRHQIEQSESCFVSRGDCPAGFAAIAYFSVANDDGFSTCRDQRHHPTATAYNDSSAYPPASHSQVTQQYNRLSELLKRKGEGEPHALPDQSLAQLSRYFPGIQLQALRFIHSRALSQGCFSDCEQIYCADPGKIEQWTRRESPLIDPQLLHQIAHAERCQLQGGRERFVSLWFRYLPARTQRQLDNGTPIDADRIHFAMFMESQAEHRARNLCHRLSQCEIDN